MSPQQTAIVDALRVGRWMTAAMVRDAIGSTASVKNIHVQVSKLRATLGDNLELESEVGPGARGYRLVRCEP